MCPAKFPTPLFLVTRVFLLLTPFWSWADSDILYILRLRGWASSSLLTTNPKLFFFHLHQHFKFVLSGSVTLVSLLLITYQPCGHSAAVIRKLLVLDFPSPSLYCLWIQHRCGWSLQHWCLGSCIWLLFSNNLFYYSMLSTPLIKLLCHQ